MSNEIELNIRLQASFVDAKNEVSACTTTNTITISAPVMESKQVVFPKLFDGAVAALLEVMWKKVEEERHEITKEKEIARGTRMELWRNDALPKQQKT